MAIGPVEIYFFDARVLDDFAAALDMLAENVVGIVIDEVNFRADLHTFPRRADDERSLAAFGDGEDHVFAAHAQIADLFFSKRGKVFKAFHGFDQRKIAAGHDAERAVFPILILVGDDVRSL